MDLHGLDLNLLVALDALLTERNVTRAGLRIHLSQSAMSCALARLRHFFRDELLIRVGRQLVLTPLAQSLVQPVRNVMLQVQAAIAVKAGFDPATADRRFSIQASDYVTTVLMTAALRSIERRAPGITFELRPHSLAAAESLKRGEIDFLVIPDVYAPEDHPREMLFEESYVCVVWAGNPLIGNRISLKQYLKMGHVVEKFFLVKPERDSFEGDFLRQHGYIRRLEVVAPSFFLLPGLVAGTNRIATVQTRIAKLAAKYLPLRILPCPIAIPKMVEMLVWNRHQDQDPGCLWFRRILKETAKRLELSAEPTEHNPIRTRKRPHARRAHSSV